MSNVGNMMKPFSHRQIVSMELIVEHNIETNFMQINIIMFVNKQSLIEIKLKYLYK